MSIRKCNKITDTIRSDIYNKIDNIVWFEVHELYIKISNNIWSIIDRDNTVGIKRKLYGKV